MSLNRLVLMELNPLRNLIASKILRVEQRRVRLINQVLNIVGILREHSNPLADSRRGNSSPVQVTYRIAGKRKSNALCDLSRLGSRHPGQYNTELLAAPAPNNVSALQVVLYSHHRTAKHIIANKVPV